MSMDTSREALERLTAALEKHLDAVMGRRGDEDAAVDDAYDAVAEAFETYEAALDEDFGETLPIVLDDLGDDDEDGDDEDVDEELDGHADEDEDTMDDDIEEFDLR